MRRAMPPALIFLIICNEVLPAQERIAPPPPDQYGVQAPPTPLPALYPQAPSPGPYLPPAAQYGQAPGPYGPPASQYGQAPGSYGPPPTQYGQAPATAPFGQPSTQYIQVPAPASYGQPPTQPMPYNAQPPSPGQNTQPAPSPGQNTQPAPSPGQNTQPAPYPTGPYGPPPPYGPYGPPPGPYGPPPYGPYGPPPGPYGPYGPPPPPVILGDPAGNPRFWIGTEALIWWTKNQPLPTPVITTGPASQGANAGGLGQPGTTSLDGPLSSGATGGFNLYSGGWFNAAHTIGMDGSIFFLGQQGAGFGAGDRTGTGFFVINEPVSGAPFVTQVSSPGVQTGSVSVNATSRFSGGDINGLLNLYRGNGLTVNLLGGFSYYELDEEIDIAANSNLFVHTTYTDNFGNVLADAPPGSSVLVVDQFGTRNQFYGGQVGAQLQYSANRWYFSGEGKLGIGSTHETVNINGNTTVFPINGNAVSLAGGNYATIQSGSYSTDRFALAPEFKFNVGYQFTPFIRGMVGYNFIYLSSVARPGNQIDNTYDGVVHPTVPMINSSFWAQGLNISLIFNF